MCKKKMSKVDLLKFVSKIKNNNFKLIGIIMLLAIFIKPIIFNVDALYSSTEDSRTYSAKYINANNMNSSIVSASEFSKSIKDFEKTLKDKNSLSYSYIKDIESKNIKLYRSKEDRIINLNIEEYVLGVVAAEVGKSFPFEALKAQAVAARTYAYNYASSYGNTPYSNAYGADLIDTVSNQVYISPKELMDKYGEEFFDSDWDNIVQAVEDTKGEVISYNGEIIKYPLYFASTKTYTEANVDVFGSDIPYLQSVKSYGDSSSSSYYDEKTFSLSELNELLSNTLGYKPLDNSLSLKSQLRISKETSGNKAYKIKVGNKEILATLFRSSLGLRSVGIELIFNSNDSVTIKTEGFGHGVGMSQWGAYYMAKDNFTYKEILSHYYTGTEISSLPKIN